MTTTDENLSYYEQQSKQSVEAAKRMAASTPSEEFDASDFVGQQEPTQEIKIDVPDQTSTPREEESQEAPEVELPMVDSSMQLPEIIRNAYSPNQTQQYINNYMYGGNAILEAKEAWENGTFDEANFQYLPVVQETISATGLDPKIVGAYMFSRGDAKLRLEVIRRIGMNAYRTLDEIHRANIRGQRSDREQDRGIFEKVISGTGDVIGDVASVFVNGDIIDAPVSGLNKSINSIGMLLQVHRGADLLSQGLQVVPFAGGALSAMKVTVTPETPEQLAELQEVLPNRELALNQTTEMFLSSKERGEVAELVGMGRVEMLRQAIEHEERKLEDNIDSNTGKVIDFITEMAATFVIPGGAAVKATNAIKATSNVAKLSIQGAALVGTEAALSAGSYRTGDENFISMLEENGVVDGPIFDFLMTSEEKTITENQVAMALEGGALGGLFGLGIFGATRALNLMKKVRTGTPEEVAEGLDELNEVFADEILDHARKLDEKTTVSGVTNEATVEATAEAAEEFSETAATTATRRAADDALEAADGSGGHLVNLKETNLNGADLHNMDLLNKQFTGYMGRNAIGDIDQDHLRGILGSNWVADHEDLLKAPIEVLQRADTVFTSKEYAALQARFKSTMSKLQGTRTMNSYREKASEVLKDLQDVFDGKAYEQLINTPSHKWTDDQVVNLALANTIRDKLAGDFINVSQALRDALKASVRDEARIMELKRIQLSLIQTMDQMQFEAARLGKEFSAGLNMAKALKASNQLRQKNLAHYNMLVRENKLTKTALEDLIKSDPHTAQVYEQMLRQASRKGKNLLKGGLTELELQELFLAGGDAMRAKDVMRMAKAAKNPTAVEQLLYLSNANILANPKTQAMMFASNLVRALYAPIRDTFALGVKRGVGQYGWMIHHAKDAFKAAKKSFKDGIGDLNVGTKADEEGFSQQKSLSELMSVKGDNALQKAGSVAMKPAHLLYRFMGAVDEFTKELVLQTNRSVAAQVGDLGEELFEMMKRGEMPTEEDYLRVLHDNKWRESTLTGRAFTSDMVEAAKSLPFQTDAIEGTLNSLIGKAARWPLFRILTARFVKTPGNVMEESLAFTLVPMLLGIRGATTNVAKRMLPGSATARNLDEGFMKFARFLGGRHVENLSSTNRTLRRRAQTNQYIASAAMVGGLGVYGAMAEDPELFDDKIVMDPTSRHYGSLVYRDEKGNTRYINPMTAEIPFWNAFMVGLTGMDMVTRMNDPKDQLEGADAIKHMMRLMIDLTASKGSLPGMVDNLSMVFDPEFGGWDQFVINNIAPFVPLNGVTRLAADMARDGEFLGRPVNFWEKLAKQVPAFRIFMEPYLNLERNFYGEATVSDAGGAQPYVSRSRVITEVDQHLIELQRSQGVDLQRESMTSNGINLGETRHSSGRSWFDVTQNALADGSVKIDGLTFREFIEMTVNSEAYKQLGEDFAEVAPGAQDDFMAQGMTGKRVNFGPNNANPQVARLREIRDAFFSKSLRYVYNNLSNDEDTETFEDKVRIYQGNTAPEFLPQFD